MTDKANTETVSSRNASDLTDRRHGARDSAAPKSEPPMRAQETEHQKAQHGADVRPETEPANDAAPEGFERKRNGPYSPTRGRGEVAEHVPKPRG